MDVKFGKIKPNTNNADNNIFINPSLANLDENFFTLNYDIKKITNRRRKHSLQELMIMIQIYLKIMPIS